MSKATVTFHKLIQDSQDYGSDDEHMVSRAFFTLEIGDKTYSDLSTDIKQPVGSAFESTVLEVSPPQGYKGPFNYAAFRDAVEQYYRNLIGSKGRGIHIEGSSNTRMWNNTFVQETKATFDIDKSRAGW